jgi:hypothetical protein
MAQRTLRRPVLNKSEEVWTHRNGVDLYTRQTRASVSNNHPEVDHVLEVAFLQDAQEQACVLEGARVWHGFAAMHMGELLQDVANCVENLNVTTRMVNQKKKGPFMSVRNRMRKPGGHNLRSISLEQFARTGAARPLIDDGTWARIETSIVQTWDELKPRLEDVKEERAHLLTRRLLTQTVDEVDQLLARIGLM